MAMLDTSRLSEGGGAKPTVNPVSKAQTSGAIGAQFKPYVMPAPAKSTAFVGPTVPKAYGANNTPAYQPATAAAVAPKVTNQSVSSPGPSNLPSPQVVNKPAATAKPKVTPTPTPAVSYVPPTPPVVKRPAPVKNLVPYVNPKLGPSDTAMSFDSTVSAETRARQKASAEAAKDMAFEITGIPSAYRLITGKNEPVFGSAAAGTALDVVGLVPFVGAAGKTLKLAGALGKTTKEIGAANAAFKGAQHLKDKGGAQLAAGIAAGAMTLAPTAGDISTAMKAGTSISQSVKAGTKATDVFTPGAASASKTTKATKAVENVKAPTPKTKKSSIDPTKVKKASDATLATGLAGDVTNAVTKANAAANAAASSAKAGDPTQTTTVNPKTTKADDSTKTKADDETQSKVDFTNKLKDKDSIDNVINTVTQTTKTVEAARTADEGGGGKPGSSSKPGGKPKPRVIPPLSNDKEKEDMKRKRRWVPSAVV